MNIPENYTRELKLQIFAFYLFLGAGLIGAVVLRHEWDRIIFAAAFFAFSFMSFHMAYLGIKYSLIQTKKHVYTKTNEPMKYYLLIILMIIGGLVFLYSGYTV